MRDVNGSFFALMAGPGDWTAANGMEWTGAAYTLAGQQAWRLPDQGRAAARNALAASKSTVVDAYGGVASVAADGMSIQSPDGAGSVPIRDLNGTLLAPKAGRFVGMALGDGRLALLASDGTNSFLELFHLRGRWGLDTPENPVVPLTLDPAGSGVAVAADGKIYVLVADGIGVFEGGPINEFVSITRTAFAPVAANPNPLRQTALITDRPSGAPVAMAVGATRIAVLLDQGSAPQTLAICDRASGTWTSAPLSATDHTFLPYMTDVALLDDDRIALMAPATDPASPIDCAVVTVAPLPQQGVTMAPYRYPMLSQAAPRFAANPGPHVQYLAQTGPRRLLPLPYPAYLTAGALCRCGVASNDPDGVWHRLYAEAYLPPGTSIAVWARAAEQSLSKDDAAAMLATIQHAPLGTTRIDAGTAAAIATAYPARVPAPTPTLAASLHTAPFHLQPPLAQSDVASELPFHPGLAALAGMPGALYELLLQRTGGANRRLTSAFLDLVMVASGDGRHSPCLRALRVHTPRFSYQDEYLPRLFHQTAISDESDQSNPASPADFRERLLAAFEGTLTPIEDRVAAAEHLLDPYAAPADTLPWLASYLGRTLDPGWPPVRQRRAIAQAGRQLRERGTYRGVCLALDIATDGAVARGEVVVLETHRLRRTDATILGVSLSGLNPLTAYGVPSGNSIVGDTLVLSAERAIDVMALLAPSAVHGADATTVGQFLDEYADRVQVAVLLQGPTAASYHAIVDTLLRAELPAQLAYDIIVTDRRFILGLSPLLDVDTFLDPPTPLAPLTLNRSVTGRDAVLRDPPALRQ